MEFGETERDIEWGFLDMQGRVRGASRTVFLEGVPEDPLLILNQPSVGYHAPVLTPFSTMQMPSASVGTEDAGTPH